MTNYRRKKSKPKEIARQFLVNERIRNDEVRVIDEESQMLGVMSRSEALAMAKEMEKDLVLINPKAEPPVVKLIEYSKFKYQQDKAEKSKSKGGDDIKNLLVSVRIAPHDLGVQARKANEFLSKSLKVRLQVKMQRREKAHPDVAKETIGKFIEMIAAVTDNYTLEAEPKLMGDSYFALLKPKK